MSSDNYFPALIRQLPTYEGQFAANKLTAANCDVLFASYPAGSEVPPHTHPTENVGVITKGLLSLTMDGETRDYGPGDWYHIPTEREHSARFSKDTGTIEFWFQH
ncbi:MAG: cupin domain-containing protein [Pseudohongiellaceae bacterium]